MLTAHFARRAERGAAGREDGRILVLGREAKGFSKVEKEIQVPSTERRSHAKTQITDIFAA